MTTQINKKSLRLLFSAVKSFVWHESGDGVGYIISERYKEYSDFFQEYEDHHGGYFSHRADDDGIVVFYPFSNCEEAIVFSDTRPLDKDAIIVEIM